MNGIINICKLPSWTSQDVVSKLKGVLHQKHIGHAGTLDPGAAGVLPICVGKATKLFDYLTARPKTYRAQVVFGIQTDTQDAYGKIMDRRPAEFSLCNLEEALSSFLGQTLQTPPQYSAIKQNGKRLYELARAGKAAEAKPREITVYEIRRLTELQGESCLLEIQCGKGTYIRTICADLGQRLGSCAHMGFLLRTAAGGLLLQDSYTIDEVAALTAKGDFSFLTPMDQVLQELPAAVFSPNAFKLLCNGNSVPANLLERADTACHEWARVYCRQSFFGIARLEDGFYKMKYMLYDEV